MTIDFAGTEFFSVVWVEYRLIGICKCGASRAAYREPEEVSRFTNRDYSLIARDLLKACKPSLFRPTRPKTPDFYSAQLGVPYRGILDDDSMPYPAPKNDEFTSVRKYVDSPSVRAFSESSIYTADEIERQYAEMTKKLARRMAGYGVDAMKPAIKQPAPPVKIPQKGRARKISWEV